LFRKVLIASRGEIARVIATIATGHRATVVFSEADREPTRAPR
jgi:acetyl/propionyl-CoA carboxylase alpha subunit